MYNRQAVDFDKDRVTREAHRFFSQLTSRNISIYFRMALETFPNHIWFLNARILLQATGSAQQTIFEILVSIDTRNYLSDRRKACF